MALLRRRSGVYRCLQVHPGHKLPRQKNVFTGHVYFRACKVLLNGQDARPRRTGYFDEGIQRHQGDGDIGRVNDVATFPANHTKVFAGTGQGVAAVPAFLQAHRQRMAVIPTTGTLVQVSAKGPQVAYLGRGHAASRLGQGCVVAANSRMLGDLGYGRHCADGQCLFGFPDTVQFRNSAQIHHPLRTDNTLFDLGENIGAASDQPALSGIPRAKLDRLVYGVGIYVFKWVQ